MMNKKIALLLKGIGVTASVILIGIGGLIAFDFFNPEQSMETISENKTVKTPLSLEPTGDLVIIEGDLLKAVLDPSILREGRLLPRKKEGMIECFELVHIDNGSKINDLKLMINDCIISFTSFKRQGDGLVSEEVILNSANAMNKVLPALDGTVRVNLRYYRDGKDSMSFYLLKR